MEVNGCRYFEIEKKNINRQNKHWSLETWNIDVLRSKTNGLCKEYYLENDYLHIKIINPQHLQRVSHGQGCELEVQNLKNTL